MAGIQAPTLFALGILLLTAFVLGELFERLGLESIIGYIVAGLILGPSVLKLVEPGSVSAFGTLGATLILFLAGLREDNVGEIFGHKKARQLGLVLLATSFAFIFGALHFTGSMFLPYDTVQQFLFLAIAYAVVDIGVPTKVMLSKGKLDTEIGRYTIRASVINVTVGLLALVGLVMYSSGLVEALLQAGAIVAFAGGFYLLHENMHKLDDYIMRFEETQAQFAITFSMLLLLAYMAEQIGLSAVVGAFFAGTLVSRSEFSESRAFQEKIKALGLGLFVPVFFGWFGLQISITGMISNFDAALYLFGLSTFIKLLVGGVMSRVQNIEDPLMVASSLVTLDIETLVILLIGIDAGILTEQMLQIFAPAVFMSIITISLLFKIDEKYVEKYLTH